MTTVKVALIDTDAQVPEYAKPGDRCADLRSVEYVIIKPRDTVKVRTGLKFNRGFDIRSRSGMAMAGIQAHNGVIDHGYRGEVVVILHNHSDAYYMINCKDKVAQAYFGEEQVKFEVVDEKDLGETERGQDGFGSTGA